MSRLLLVLARLRPVALVPNRRRRNRGASRHAGAGRNGSDAHEHHMADPVARQRTSQRHGGKRTPQLVLNSADGRESWSATVGCNQMSGGVAVNGNGIAFKSGMSTLMACPPPLDVLEKQLGRSLMATTQWRIHGNRLEFRDDAGVQTFLCEAIFRGSSSAHAGNTTGADHRSGEPGEAIALPPGIAEACLRLPPCTSQAATRRRGSAISPSATASLSALAPSRLPQPTAASKLHTSRFGIRGTRHRHRDGEAPGFARQG